MANRIIVAGAGASGLMAAIAAARGGAKVTILEAMERPGKKLLMTGNGRCNLTNMEEHLPDAYHGADADFAAEVVRQFDAGAVRDFFQELGLLTTEKNGYVYPYTNQASSVLEVLLAEVRRLGIRLKLSEKIKAIRKEGDVWKAETATWTYEADCLILSCGSKCVPATGSDGSGYELAKMAGLRMGRVVPALVPLTCKEKFLANLAGVRCQAGVTLYRKVSDGQAQEEVHGNGQSDRWQKIGTETGELQWTKYGISGIVVFQLSRYVALAEAGETFQVTLDFLPQYFDDTVETVLASRAAALAGEKVPVLLRGILPEKLIPVILERAGISPKKACKELKETELKKLLQTCRRFVLAVTGTKSFDVCQVCAGGVLTEQISPETMECRKIQGLYVTGELLDVDGPCGGYNLQWAWSSGYAAGTHAAAQKKNCGSAGKDKGQQG